MFEINSEPKANGMFHGQIYVSASDSRILLLDQVFEANKKTGNFNWLDLEPSIS